MPKDATSALIVDDREEVWPVVVRESQLLKVGRGSKHILVLSFGAAGGRRGRRYSCKPESLTVP